MNYRDALEKLDERLNLNCEFDSIERFKIGVCQSLDLSAVARDALEVATQYLSHMVSDMDLERARVSCWNSIEGRDCNLSDREVAGTRAVLCTMYPRGWPDDAFSVLDIFKDFAMAAGANPDNLVLALQTAFADVLGRGAARPAIAVDRTLSHR